MIFSIIKLKDKLLLAQDEGHLFNILNEKIVWNNNECSFPLNKKQVLLSQNELEEVCQKLFQIMHQPKEKFLNNTADFSELIVERKKSEDLKSFHNKEAHQTIRSPEENTSNNFKMDEKSNIDNELLCEDEVDPISKLLKKLDRNWKTSKRTKHRQKSK